MDTRAGLLWGAMIVRFHHQFIAITMSHLPVQSEAGFHNTRMRGVDDKGHVTPDGIRNPSIYRPYPRP